MGSRRAMGRGWGLGGRAGAGGDGEDDGPVWTPGPASRSYLLSVRPETRSTFCSIIAQLTEETQPLFETTLKSRAVSEDSDVRFTCIVTGYPEPEVTWYKDDTELDRYCGLPKYEITHQGNRHTLQLYRCREEDAAIYQASARNTKGIVSCSGVLEVGTMTEYKIHQRWFAKLKRKAAAKMREIEQSWRHGKEAAAEDMLRKISPDRFQRKRRLSGAEEAVPSAPVEEMEEGSSAAAAWQEGETESTQHPALGLINSFAPGEAPTNGEPAPENGEDGEHGLLTYICEVMERGPQNNLPKESGAKKKRKDEESKPGEQMPELEKTDGSQSSSENGVPAAGKPDSSRREKKPMDTQPAQTQPRGRIARGPGPSGIESTRKKASVMGIQDKVQDAPAPAAAPAPASAPAPAPAPTPVPSLSSEQVYFSLKDMYLESTRAAKPQGQEMPPPRSTRVPGESPSGKVPVEARGQKVPMVPGQPPPSMVPPPIKPLNRKRFAPPKPKVEPTATSSSSQVPESAAQTLGRALPPASAQVPTPPARRRHSTRDSPLQGQTSHGTPGEAPESQTTMAPAASASSSSSDTLSVDHSPSGSQGATEPMETETQEDGRAPTDGRTGGRKKTQIGGQLRVDGRTERGETEASQRTQIDKKVQVDVVTQGSERPQSDRSSQKGSVTERRVDTQVGQTQVEERLQQGLRDARKEEETQSVGSIPTAFKTQSEQPSAVSLSSPPGALKLSPSECPGALPVMECSEKSPEASRVQEEPSFTVRSEEPSVTAFRSHEDTPQSPQSGNRMCPVQLPLEGNSEQLGGETHERPEWSGLVKAKQEDNTFQKKERPGKTLHEDLSSGQSTGLSQDVPTTPSFPATGLPEGLPSATASQHISTEDSLPSRGQDLLGSAPTLQLGPGSPTQSAPPEAMATSSEGACAKEPHVEGRSSGARSCDPGLIDSLKNYLLLLLKLSSPETNEARAESQEVAATGGLASSPTLVPTMEVAGLSPRTSRRILDRVENNHLVQSAQTLLLSPCTSRRLTGLLDREVQAGQQALAAAQCSRALGPSPLTIPAIVVGEEGSGASEGEDSGERTSQGSDKNELLGEVDGQTVESRSQEQGQEEASPGEALTGLPAATPEELALGARRKRFLPKVRAASDGDANKTEERESPTVSPRGPRKGLAPGSPGTPGRERRSPTQARKISMLEVPGTDEELVTEDLASRPKASALESEPALDEGKQDALAKPRKAKDLLKAPQVIRKIRVEQFPDSSGSLKLWCQFFNIVSDSVLTWVKDQQPVGEVSRSAGDEGPAALAIVQASPVDCGVYRCTIQNEYGSASTDFCLSPEVLSGFISREEGEVGEEIEMTPMVFAKGLADSGCWGDKLFGRLVSEELQGGGHGLQKASQAKVIYGLEPIFESGRTCVIKVSSLLVFGPSSETSLLGRNYDVTIQGCKIQNMSREYCKIFAAEARATSGFGEVPEIIPLYLIYRPANTIPYATLEEDLGKPLQPYCSRQWGCAGAPAAASSSEAMQKCQTFQHWLYQWTNGSFLVTDLAGADWKTTDVQIATKLRGYQGLKESCFPALLDQFASSHQCNSYCEMLGLKPLKGPEAAHPQAKAKGSKSPSAGRKGSQLSPQPQKKGLPSPQGTRKCTPSSKATPQASQAVIVQSLGEPPAQEGSSKAQGMR